MAGNKKAHFLSDLHLFASRSSADAVEHAIHDAARRSHTLILGGDIFDFRWSRWGDSARTVAESVRWLERLLRVNPECEFHYVLGNHDANQAFIARLEGLTEQFSNLRWHPHWLRLEDCVFLHGDVIDAGIPLVEDYHEQLDALRRRREERALPPKVQHQLYDAVVHAGVHRWISQVANPNLRVLHRVRRYLDWAGHGESSGAEHVFFGHTHRPLEAVVHQGVRYHNPGATIKGLDFRILEVPLRAARSAPSAAVESVVSEPTA
jgi:UDP-2,3-diacylglucosamine hydrolase